MLKTINRCEMIVYVNKRKHGEQLNIGETKGLYARIKNINEWNYINKHLEDRMIEKGIKINDYIINRLLNDSNIVEYKIDEKRDKLVERVVLRSNHAYNKGYYLIVVFDLTKKVIVIAWLNHNKDNHKTIDWSQYDKDMKVFY